MINEKINYIELATKDLAKTKQFFETAFAWQFEDFGEGYTAFSAKQAGLDGGFYQADLLS